MNFFVTVAILFDESFAVKVIVYSPTVVTSISSVIDTSTEPSYASFAVAKKVGFLVFTTIV